MQTQSQICEKNDDMTSSLPKNASKTSHQQKKRKANGTTKIIEGPVTVQVLAKQRFGKTKTEKINIDGFCLRNDANKSNAAEERCR